ncbi:MAG: universal stress protein [Opitutaceae bacterium]|jgi:nucleotide-binding universal stress UspA family protein
MYNKILVTLDATPTDRAIIEHIKALAKAMGSRVALLHVADGWAARTYGADAGSLEITHDKAYLEEVRAEFQSAGILTDAELAYGEPGKEIVKWVEEKGCDLVAMSTHGHRFIADLFLGSTSRQVRHRVSVPVLLLRTQPELAEAWVHEVLEAGQLSTAKLRFGRAKLTRGTVLLLWGLRIYVFLMIFLIGVQIWRAMHADG